MLTLAEIVYAIRGLSLLVRFDARGFEYFDRSIAGFWRSFQVAVLVAPIHAILLVTFLPLIEPTASWQQILSAFVGLYIIGWFLYPVVAFEICRLFNKSEEYVGYIVVYNWLALITSFAHLLISVPIFLGVWATDTGGLIGELLYYALLVLAWFVARNSLRIEWLPAVGLVFVDYVLTEILNATLVFMMK
ncbi:MAG: hypothetical protein ACREEE_11100 [Dongiaceae bacterium]